MNVFFEFYKVLKRLRKRRVNYVLIGGVAVAFYAEPRFTKDIDILIEEEDVEKARKALSDEGYTQTAPPWTFKQSKMTLYRFLKWHGEDEMIIDVLTSGEARIGRIIRDAHIAESKMFGKVRLASRKDLIWLKKRRLSMTDRADIEKLRHE